MSGIDINSIPADLIPYYSPYGYIPSKNISIAFIVLFGVTTIIHLAQAIKYRLCVGKIVKRIFAQILQFSARICSSAFRYTCQYGTPSAHLLFCSCTSVSLNFGVSDTQISKF
ncbi:hypothetical protein BJ165DRAFT_1515223 [Panaeolus papilionaceus]|nr:hypothetical protein BJ165DRAFT_1515223 [Panaeolus papilionaceus]